MTTIARTGLGLPCVRTGIRAGAGDGGGGVGVGKPGRRAIPFFPETEFMRGLNSLIAPFGASARLCTDAEKERLKTLLLGVSFMGDRRPSPNEVVSVAVRFDSRPDKVYFLHCSKEGVFSIWEDRFPDDLRDLLIKKNVLGPLDGGGGPNPSWFGWTGIYKNNALKKLGRLDR